MKIQLYKIFSVYVAYICSIECIDAVSVFFMTVNDAFMMHCCYNDPLDD